MPVELECLKRLIVRIKFVLCLLGWKCKSPAQGRSFEKEWLASGRLGHFASSWSSLFKLSLLFCDRGSPSLVVLRDWFNDLLVFLARY